MSIKEWFVRILFVFVSLSANAQNLDDVEYGELRESVLKQIPDSFKQVDSLLNISKMTSYDKARLNILKGLIFLYSNEYDQSEKVFKLTLQSFEQCDSVMWQAEVLLNLSTLYSSQLQFTKAATSLYQAQAIADKNNDFTLKAKIAVYFGNLNYVQGNKTNALAYLESAVIDYEEVNDSLALATLYNNLAVLYKEEQEFRKAIDYNNKSLLLSSGLHDELSVANSYNNIATNFEELFKQTDSTYYIEQALLYYDLSARISRNFPREWNTGLENKARIYSLIGKKEKADVCYSELLKNSYDKKEYQKLHKIFKQELLEALNIHNIQRARHYFMSLDTVQYLIQEVQSRDFKEMLQNQKELYETKKIEKEKDIKLKDEQHKRLLAENASQRIRFILLMLIALVVIVMLIVIQYFKDVRYKNGQEKNKLENRILRSQMNPHFIFNVLTAIQNTLLDNEPLKTSAYIARFSRLIRQNFDFTSRDSISLDEEIDALQNYIETQKVRFGDKFKYHINIENTIDTAQTKVPPMLLQPIVENAIEHGLKNKKADGVLEIKVGLINNKLHFVVTDNGPGYKTPVKDGKEHSMDVLKNRLMLPGFGDEESLKIKSLDNPSGTQVEFQLSIR
jgi:sensor histidine kinase YesM